jgi:hypothetical protein
MKEQSVRLLVRKEVKTLSPGVCSELLLNAEPRKYRQQFRKNGSVKVYKQSQISRNLQVSNFRSNLKKSAIASIQSRKNMQKVEPILSAYDV